MLLDTLMVRISGDASGLSGATESAKDKLRGLGDAADSASGGFGNLQGIGGTAMVALGNVISNVASMAADKLGELVSAAADASDSTQKFTSTLDFAGLDTSTIDSLIESTQAYADQTVYELSDIRNITAQLAANGVDNFDQLAEAAGNLNAVAGGNADTFASVGMVLTQTAGQGKLTTENFNQLSDAIPGASGRIQQALADMGAYTGNFRDAMTEGQISAEEFNQAILDLGLTDAAQEAATSTATFEGAFGNLEAACVNLISQGLDLIKPAATDAIGALSTFIGEIPAALGQITGVFGQVQENIASFEQEIGGTANVADTIWVAMQTIGQAFGLSAEQMMPFSDAIASVFDTIETSVQTISTTMQPYIDTFLTSLSGLASAFSMNILPVVQAFVGYLTTFGNTIMTVLTPVIQTVGPMVMTLATQIVNAVTNIANIVMPAMTNIFNTATQILNAIIPIVMPIINAIMTAFQTAFPAIQSAVQGAFTVIQSVISAVMGEVQGIINTVLALIQGDWNGVLNGLKSIAESIWNGIKGVVKGTISAMQGYIEGGLSFIQSLWESAWSTVSSFLNEAWEGIKNGVSSGIDSVIQFFTDLPGNILGALGDLGSLLWNAGTSIIDGLLGGLQSAAEGMFSWVSGIAGTIASLKGPLPYDRKLLIPAGKAIVYGLQTSMENAMEDVYDMVGDIGPQISDLVQTGYKFTVTPNIDLSKAPVIGLSDVNARITPDFATDLSAYGTQGNQYLALKQSVNEMKNVTAVNSKMLATMQDMLTAVTSEEGSSVNLYIDGTKMATTLARPMNRALSITQKRSSLNGTHQRS